MLEINLLLLFVGKFTENAMLDSFYNEAAPFI